MTDADTADQVKRLRIKSDMLRMGEPIAFGSDADALDEAADAIERLTRERDEARLRGDVHQGPMQGFAAIDPATANVDWQARATNLAADVERLTRERDAEKADAAKWFAEYMALSHKQKGPVPDAALQARIAKLEAALKAINEIARCDESFDASHRISWTARTALEDKP